MGTKAVIDMGSNGIRFSIHVLNGPSARILPTLYHDHCSISLYKAQWAFQSRRPIPQSKIDLIISRFLYFKAVCSKFAVDQIDCLATEATRTALNSEDFLSQIQLKTGISVRLLSQAEEALFGVYGIASSLPSVHGLAMDLGGGSTQISFVYSSQGKVECDEKSIVSLPYGAAALKNRLDAVDDEEKVEELSDEIQLRFQEVLDKFKISDADQENLDLYLSGGGWRRIGQFIQYASNDVSGRNHINGFTVPFSAFQKVPKIIEHLGKTGIRLAGISKSKAEQFPAISILVDAIASCQPCPETVTFCQGGVREGFLFHSLSQECRALDPLRVASARFAPRPLPSTPSTPYTFPPDSPAFNLLLNSIPPTHRSTFPTSILHALANLLHFHASYPAILRPSVALRTASTGILADAYGIGPSSRAFINLALCERWGGKVSAEDQDAKDELARDRDPGFAVWARYLGKVAALIGAIDPTGRFDDGEDLIRIQSHEINTLSLLVVKLKESPMTNVKVLEDYLTDIGDAGDVDSTLRKRKPKDDFVATATRHNPLQPLVKYPEWILLVAFSGKEVHQTDELELLNAHLGEQLKSTSRGIWRKTSIFKV